MRVHSQPQIARHFPFKPHIHSSRTARVVSSPFRCPSCGRFTAPPAVPPLPPLPCFPRLFPYCIAHPVCTGRLYPAHHPNRTHGLRRCFPPRILPFVLLYCRLIQLFVVYRPLRAARPFPSFLRPPATVPPLPPLRFLVSLPAVCGLPSPLPRSLFPARSAPSPYPPPACPFSSAGVLPACCSFAPSVPRPALALARFAPVPRPPSRLSPSFSQPSPFLPVFSLSPSFWVTSPLLSPRTVPALIPLPHSPVRYCAHPTIQLPRASFESQPTTTYPTHHFPLSGLFRHSAPPAHDAPLISRHPILLDPHPAGSPSAARTPLLLPHMTSSHLFSFFHPALIDSSAPVLSVRPGLPRSHHTILSPALVRSPSPAPELLLAVFLFFAGGSTLQSSLPSPSFSTSRILSLTAPFSPPTLPFSVAYTFPCSLYVPKRPLTSSTPSRPVRPYLPDPHRSTSSCRLWPYSRDIGSAHTQWRRPLAPAVALLCGLPSLPAVAPPLSAASSPFGASPDTVHRHPSSPFPAPICQHCVPLYPLTHPSSPLYDGSVTCLRRSLPSRTPPHHHYRSESSLAPDPFTRFSRRSCNHHHLLPVLCCAPLLPFFHQASLRLLLLTRAHRQCRASLVPTS